MDGIRKPERYEDEGRSRTCPLDRIVDRFELPSIFVAVFLV
jgi:hypothetical protein